MIFCSKSAPCMFNLVASLSNDNVGFAGTVAVPTDIVAWTFSDYIQNKGVVGRTSNWQMKSLHVVARTMSTWNTTKLGGRFLCLLLSSCQIRKWKSPMNLHIRSHHHRRRWMALGKDKNLTCECHCVLNPLQVFRTKKHDRSAVTTDIQKFPPWILVAVTGRTTSIHLLPWPHRVMRLGFGYDKHLATAAWCQSCSCASLCVESRSWCLLAFLFEIL